MERAGGVDFIGGMDNQIHQRGYPISLPHSSSSINSTKYFYTWLS